MSYPKDVNSVVVGAKIFTERHQESAHLTDKIHISVMDAFIHETQRIRDMTG